MLAHFCRQYTISSYPIQMRRQSRILLVLWEYCQTCQFQRNKKRREKLIDRRQSHTSLLVLDCSSNDGFSRSCRDEDKQDDSRSSDRLYRFLFNHRTGALKKLSSIESRNLRMNAMQCMSNKLHDDGRVKIRSLPTCRQCQRCLLMYVINGLRCKSSHWQINSKQNITLSALTREWSNRYERQPIERNGFWLLFYNISSLRMHLEDLLDYISASYPNIWALNGMYFNDDANDQLASYFKSQYTTYCQHGLNSFCGVCLAIALDVSHRIASELNNVDNIIDKHVMICL